MLLICFQAIFIDAQSAGLPSRETKYPILRLKTLSASRGVRVRVIAQEFQDLWPMRCLGLCPTLLPVQDSVGGYLYVDRSGEVLARAEAESAERPT